MELLQLKYFCDAASSENFSKTAKKYLVPTSNISQSVKRLEKELGVELFEHRANKITLNSEGKEFYKRISQALLLIEEAKASVTEAGEEIKGDIRLVCLNNRRIVTEAIERFIREHRQVNFIIQHSIESEEDFDLVISDVCPRGYSDGVLIADEEICLAMSENHPLARQSDLKLSDLKNERFISMPKNSSLQRITADTCLSAGFTPNIAIQTDDPFYLRKYIEMGLGIAFVPTNSWRGLFHGGTILKSIDNIRRKTYAYLPKDRRIKRAVRAFLEILKDEQGKGRFF